jgi:hypothetical protein
VGLLWKRARNVSHFALGIQSKRLEAFITWYPVRENAAHQFPSVFVMVFAPGANGIERIVDVVWQTDHPPLASRIARINRSPSFSGSPTHSISAASVRA